MGTLQTIAGWVMPSVCSVAIGLLVAHLKRMKQESREANKIIQEENNTLKLGVQALLRDRLYQQFNKWEEQGYAPLYARENFENVYKQYHNMGQNGVMDDIRAKFLALPTEKKEGTK